MDDLLKSILMTVLQYGRNQALQYERELKMASTLADVKIQLDTLNKAVADDQQAVSGLLTAFKTVNDQLADLQAKAATPVTPDTDIPALMDEIQGMVTNLQKQTSDAIAATPAAATPAAVSTVTATVAAVPDSSSPTPAPAATKTSGIVVPDPNVVGSTANVAAPVVLDPNQQSGTTATINGQPVGS